MGRNSSFVGSFLICAMSPDDRLFQLERIKTIAKGSKEEGYGIFEVDKAGTLIRAYKDEFRCTIDNRSVAVKLFRLWAKEHEYVVFENECYESW